jgi:hypothetical protein
MIERKIRFRQQGRRAIASIQQLGIIGQRQVDDGCKNWDAQFVRHKTPSLVTGREAESDFIGYVRGSWTFKAVFY